MSPTRRACVLASVMLGVLVTVVFVWVMPCGVDDLCGVAHPNPGGLFQTAHSAHGYDDAWMQVFNGLGGNETIAVVNPKTGLEELLLFYYQPLNTSSPDLLWDSLARTDCSKIERSSEEEDDYSRSRCNDRLRQRRGEAVKCGLMLLSEQTGKQIWQSSLKECPSKIFCHLMTHNSAGNTACLVIGSQSLIRLFDPHSGHVIWDTTDHNNSNTGPTLLYPGQPVLIPDVTGDLHPDLLFPGVYKPAPETRRFPSQESILMNHLRSLPSQAQTTTETRLYGSGAADLFKTSSTLKYTSEEDTAAHFEEQPPPFVGNVVNEMVLVSGITGKIVGKPYKVKQCHQLTEVTIDGESIDYSCVMPSGNKLAGKIPVVSLIHQMIGPQAPEGNISQNLIYPSITPFLPTPDGLTNRYCQVEVTNTGHCPLCEAKVQLMSTTEGENLWQAQYDGSAVVDWEPLIIGDQCRGLVLKLIAWDDLSGMLTSPLQGNVPINNQRTTRSSFGNDDEEVENDDGEEGFSAAGENLDTPIDEKPKISVSSPQYLIQSQASMKKRIYNYKNEPHSSNSLFFNPPGFHVRHNRIKHNDEKKYKISERKSSSEKEAYFGHPAMKFRSGKRNIVYEKNRFGTGAKFAIEPNTYGQKENDRSSDMSGELSPKLAAVYSKDLDENEENAYDRMDQYRPETHSSKDFELPINLFGLPIDTQPPNGFSLQRLAEYTMLVKFNGSSWVDIPLKKEPLFQLCKDAVCFPDEKLSRKLVVTPLKTAVGVWKVVNTITSVSNGPSTSISANSAHASEPAWSLKTFVSKIYISP